MAGKKSKRTGGRTTRAPRESSLGAGLLHIADELESIDALLQTVPDLERATRLANEALAPESGTCADALARWAKDACGVDLDERSREDSNSSEPDLSDLPNAASVVTEAARWRLRRHDARGAAGLA